MNTNQTVKSFAIKLTWVVISLLLCFMMNAQKILEVNSEEESQIIKENTDSGKVYEVAEEMPRFPGCEELETIEEKKPCAQKKLLEYVYGNLKYPEEAREKSIQGMVVVHFYIDTHGELQNLELVRDIGGGTGQAALDVFKKMIEEGIRWVPGKENGEVVNVKFNMPIRFDLK